MPFLTNFAPAAAGYDDAALGGSHRYIMVAATAGDGHIFYNWQNLGESWQGWTEIPGDQRTDTSPAVSFSPVGDVAFQVDMWAAIKGMDGLIYINNAANNDQQQLGTAFGSWFPLAGLETRLAPAGAVVSNGIWPIGSYTPVTAAVAEDGTVNLNTDGQWLLLPGVGRTDAAVAAALVGDNYLFIVAKGLDGQLYLNQGALGGPYVGWNAIGFSSNLAPSASSNNNVTVLAATGTDGRIYYDWWTLGEGGHGMRPLDGEGRTDASPAVALVGGNQLVIVAKGLDDQVYFNSGELGGAFVGWSIL